MTDKPRKTEPALKLNMSFGEALTRFVQVRPDQAGQDRDMPIPLIEDPDTGDIFLIYRGKEGATTELRFEEEQPWFTQAQLARIFGVDVRTANDHIEKFRSEGELAGATIRKFRIVRQEGTRQVTREIDHYGLDVAFYVGYRVNSQQGTLFRRWATDILIRFATKGFVIDSQRLKVAGEFDRIAELREIVRDIRASESNVYAELRRICSLCQDYDPSLQEARDFYTRMQAKLYWATMSKTPSMVLAERADASEPNMGVQTFAKEEVLKSDIKSAKNFLVGEELRELNRLTTILLDVFEDQMDMGNLTLMSDAATLLDEQLRGLKRPVLTHGGRISHSVAEKHADAEYKRFDEARRAARTEAALRELANLKTAQDDLPKPRRGRPPKDKARPWTGASRL